MDIEEHPVLRTCNHIGFRSRAYPSSKSLRVDFIIICVKRAEGRKSTVFGGLTVIAINRDIKSQTKGGGKSEPTL